VRELSRKTQARRFELYGLLERGMAGGQRLAKGGEESEEEDEFPVDKSLNQPESTEKTAAELEAEAEAVAAPNVSKIHRAKTEMDVDFISKIIINHVLFEAVPLERIMELTHSFSWVEIAGGDRLLKQDRHNEYFYILVKGDFKQFRDNDDGRGSQPFARAEEEPGTCFGCIGIGNPTKELCRREVVAEFPSELWGLSRSQYIKLCGMSWSSRLYLSLKDYLRNTVWFPETTNDSELMIQWLIENMEPEVWEAGDTVILQGDQENQDLFFIRQGNVVVTGGTLDDDQCVRLEPGEIFGETALLFDTPRTAKVVCGKECKKCNGRGSVGNSKRRYPCTKCGSSGCRTDGGLVILFRLKAEKYAEFLTLADADGNDGAAGVYMMRYVLRRCVKTAYPKVPWTNNALARLSEAFEYVEYGAGEVCANQSDVWSNFSVVVKGHVKCFQNDMFFKDCRETALLSNFDNLRAPFSMTCPLDTHLACLSREKVRDVVASEISVALVGTVVELARQFEFNIICPLHIGTWGRVAFVEHIKSRKKYVCHNVVKQRVDEHWGFDMKRQAEDHVCQRREVLELSDSSCVANLVMSGGDKHNLYMWVEFAPGGSLELLLKKQQRLSVTASMFYFSNILSAVEDMQRKRIIHRDLCPANCLIAEDGYLKLVGFGRAKILHRPDTRTICGKVALLHERTRHWTCSEVP